MTSEDIFFYFFGASFFSMAISWISFSRISMARIEADMKKDGLPRPASWDGMGARAVWYCHAIVLPLGVFNALDNPLFDVKNARLYAKPIDKVLGLAMMISSTSFIVIGLVGGFVLDLY